MAEQDNSIVVSQQQLTALKKRAAMNKTLLIAVLVLSGIVFTIMATGMTVMFLRISALTEPLLERDENDLQQQLVTIDQQIMALDDFRNEELTKIVGFTQQLQTVAKDCSAQKSTAYQQFLLSRETDYQQLLTTVKSGASSLAAMNKGSKKWLDSHNAALDNLKKNSVQRTKTLQSF
jgi:hypothetical protein